MTRILAVIICLVISFSNLIAVEVNSSVDFVSAYNWRAMDVGDSPAIQPKINLKAYDFEFEFWGSQAFSAGYDYNDQIVKFNEVDLVLKYNLKTDYGTFSPFFTDFFYPCEGRGYFDFKGTQVNDKDSILSRGGHWYNISLQYKGPEQFPIEFLFDHCFHNDPDKSIYFELAYPFHIDGHKFKLHTGLTNGKTRTYDVKENKWTFVNIGISLEKSITLSDSFSLPIGTALYLQPEKEQLFFVFKISLK